MNAYIATIQTESNSTTELIIAADEQSAQADADCRHAADGSTVLVTIEPADFGPVIVASAPATTGRRQRLGYIAWARFSAPNSEGIDYRLVEVLHTYPGDRALIKLANGRQQMVSMGSIVSDDAFRRAA